MCRVEIFIYTQHIECVLCGKQRLSTLFHKNIDFLDFICANELKIYSVFYLIFAIIFNIGGGACEF